MLLWCKKRDGPTKDFPNSKLEELVSRTYDLAKKLVVIGVACIMKGVNMLFNREIHVIFNSKMQTSKKITSNC